MKKISLFELANLLGGYSYSSCAEVQFAASTHQKPEGNSDPEEDAEEDFWDEWCREFDRLCV